MRRETAVDETAVFLARTVQSGSHVGETRPVGQGLGRDRTSRCLDTTN